jgi:hypothetical protein
MQHLTAFPLLIPPGYEIERAVTGIQVDGLDEERRLAKTTLLFQIPPKTSDGHPSTVKLRLHVDEEVARKLGEFFAHVAETMATARLPKNVGPDGMQTRVAQVPSPSGKKGK